MMKRRMILAMATAGLAVAGGLRAENWPAWRGADGNGASDDRETPSSFSPSRNLAWKVQLPGRGCSTPVVWGEQIIVTCPIDGKDGVLAYDRSGKELWRVSLGKALPGRGQRVGSACNSSPLTDDKHVFVYFKSGNLAALTMDGKTVWKMNVFEKYGEDKLWWDVGTSPVFADGNLMLAVLQSEGNSFLLSLDKATGKEVWMTPRKYEGGPESGDAYTTPHVVEVDGVETIVTWGADHLTGHAAKDGRLLWECGNFNPKRLKAWRVIASAVVADGMAVVPYARGDAIAGIRLGGSGDVTKTAWVWKQDDLGTDAASPVAAGGKVFLLKDSGRERGRVTCLEIATGKVLWESMLPKSAKQFYASPLVAGTKIYFAREDGVVFCARLTKNGLADIVENKIEEVIIASPVAVDGKLLLRGDQHLFCFGN
jgi:outer membrane protein assembly factor BamB